MEPNYVRFRGQLVEPIGNDVEVLGLVALGGLMVLLLALAGGLIKGRQVGVRLASTGFMALVPGPLLGMLAVGFPATLFGEFVYPITNGFLNTIGVFGAGGGATWAAIRTWEMTGRDANRQRL